MRQGPPRRGVLRADDLLQGLEGRQLAGPDLFAVLLDPAVGGGAGAQRERLRLSSLWPAGGVEGRPRAGGWPWSRRSEGGASLAMGLRFVRASAVERMFRLVDAG